MPLERSFGRTRACDTTVEIARLITLRRAGYRREVDGFAVWSIGPDMQDGGAARGHEEFSRLPPHEREADPYDYDIVFRRR
jgi:hypothetical protein